MIKLEWFTLAEAAEIWGAKDGVAGMIRLILEGDDQRLSASYILPTPWKAYYIKRIEEPSADPEKWFSPETKEIWRIDIEVTGLVNLYFSGNCSNADSSITIRGDGSVSNDWPSQIYISLPGSNTTSSLHLISTGETPEELQDCLNIEPEQDLVITRKQLESFARTVGRSSVLTKLKSLPTSSNIAATEILIESERRVDFERNQRHADDPFDTTKSQIKYRVPEGHDPVRLASTSGHVIIVNEEPRYIMAGFEHVAVEKGCIAVEDDIPILTIEPEQRLRATPIDDVRKWRNDGISDEEIAVLLDKQYPSMNAYSKMKLIDQARVERWEQGEAKQGRPRQWFYELRQKGRKKMTSSGNTG